MVLLSGRDVSYSRLEFRMEKRVII